MYQSLIEMTQNVIANMFLFASSGMENRAGNAMYNKMIESITLLLE